jgi:hypothetical protein
MLLCVCMQALVFGGGLNATIAGGLFSNLSAASGIVVLARSRLHVKDTIISNNSVVKGVLYVSHSGSLLVENVTLSGNTAFAEGPALYIVQGFAMISSSTISGNAAQSGGGALYVKGGAKLVLFNSTFERNVAGKGEEAFGGVMHVTDSTVMVTDCNFTNNLATQGAGAIYIGLENQPADSEKCRYGDLPMRLEIRGCNFSGNLAPTGGALAVYYAAAMISNSSFTDNRARPVQVSAHVCLDRGGAGGQALVPSCCTPLLARHCTAGTVACAQCSTLLRCLLVNAHLVACALSACIAEGLTSHSCGTKP